MVAEFISELVGELTIPGEVTEALGLYSIQF